jgi:very-short-patch-repair endonuclease
MVIVEIDSRAHHLLEPGAWEHTQERRAALSSLGFLVLPLTPQQLRDTPELVIAAVRSGLQRAVAS